MASNIDTWESKLNYIGVIREHDIRALAHNLVEPLPDSSQYQPASLDLTIGAIITAMCFSYLLYKDNYQEFSNNMKI